MTTWRSKRSIRQSESNEEYSLPAGSDTGIPSGDEIAMPNENHSIHENRPVIGSRVIEQNPNVSSLEIRRILLMAIKAKEEP
jgi:hypothetical protein|mmetsp:Transcript_14613/g.26481  ORF Transcript_14613/g.26481 Transcript_14613/m.26481 type:complete len:82 (-) Transcript_14613:14-259(-)